VLKPGGALLATTQPPSQDVATAHRVKANMLITETSSGNLRRVAQLVDAGEIKTCIGKVYPLTNVAAAWRDSRSRHVEGKIVFTLGTGN
jgi:NADPH:quinone reductase-like Zn-dependent oxidoreductase